MLLMVPGIMWLPVFTKQGDHYMLTGGWTKSAPDLYSVTENNSDLLIGAGLTGDLDDVRYCRDYIPKTP
jgi:hypothetical protein